MDPHSDALRNRLEKTSRILLIRLRSLGDAILTLPLIEALNRWRPELKQSILIEAPFAPVFRNHPAIDEVLTLRTRRGNESHAWTRSRAVVEIAKRRFPAVFNLHGGSTSMAFTAFSGAPIRIGQQYHRGSWLYSDGIPSSTEVWGMSTIHTVEHQMTLLRWLGIPIGIQSARLHLEDGARARIRERLGQNGTEDYVVIQPTATLATKQWPPARFAQLGDWLAARVGLPVIYTAAPHEASVLNEVRRSAAHPHVYRSDLDLDELFALIENSRLFVGNDSGPMHAAAMLGRPVVVVWGSSNFKAWRPWSTDYEAVGSDLACIPCPGYACRVYGEPRCILDIPVSRAAEACERLLARTIISG